MRAVEVTESSQIAAARRAATDMASALGSDEVAAGKVAIVATELATNLIKHGSGGQLLVSSYEDGAAAGVELIALDRGRGIANLQECLRDGFSSAGSAGHGLGAIRRQSRTMEVASWPAVGTAILARVDIRDRQTTDPASPCPPSGISHGSVCVPKPGEEVCGDAACVVDTPAGRTSMVVDGLGHGPEAAIAAMEALRLFNRHRLLPVPQILEYLHAGLRTTRGAAVAVGRFDKQRSTMVYGGIGNIAGSIHTGHETRRMISLNGTAGHVARRIHTFDYPCAPDALLIMHSDGLATNWSLERYPGITRMHPTLIAAVLYRDHARRRDDATVLVVHVGEPP